MHTTWLGNVILFTINYIADTHKYRNAISAIGFAYLLCKTELFI